MKKRQPLLKVLLVVAFAVSVFSATNAWARYSIQMNFMVDNPIMFPVGRILPDNMSNLGDIEFEDINPFFQITCSGDDNGEEVYLHVRLSGDGEEIFTASSEQFPVSILLGRTLSNYDLARIPEINLGNDGGGSIANRIMQYISGNWLREGVYSISAFISLHPDFISAASDNLGSSSLSFYAQTTNQITLLNPLSGEQIETYPRFQWSFPRREGVIFTLRVVAGQADVDPNDGFSSLDPDDVYAEIDIPVRPGQEGGDMSYYGYSGISPERALEPNRTYFWQVEAAVTTMFEGETEPVLSPAESFLYAPPGNGGSIGGIGGEDNGGGGNDEGGLLGGSGNLAGGPMGGAQEEGGPPQNTHPIFTLLQNYLPNDLYLVLVQQLSDLSDYSVATIRIGDDEVSLEQLGMYIATNNPSFVSMSISD